MRMVSLLIAGSCGRIHFEPVGVDGTTSTSDGALSDGAGFDTTACAKHFNCLGTSCSSSGLGQFYVSCKSLGIAGVPASYDAAMASLAAQAWGQGLPLAITCGTDDIMTIDNGTLCVTWQYTGSFAGYVDFGTSCGCPNGGTSTTWN